MAEEKTVDQALDAAATAVGRFQHIEGLADDSHFTRQSDGTMVNNNSPESDIERAREAVKEKLRIANEKYHLTKREQIRYLEAIEGDALLHLQNDYLMGNYHPDAEKRFLEEMEKNPTRAARAAQEEKDKEGFARLGASFELDPELHGHGARHSGRGQHPDNETPNGSHLTPVSYVTAEPNANQGSKHHLQANEIGQELQLVLAKAGFSKHNAAFGDDGKIGEATKQDAKESGRHYINDDGTLNKEAIRADFKKEFGEQATISVAETELQKPHYNQRQAKQPAAKNGVERA